MPQLRAVLYPVLTLLAAAACGPDAGDPGGDPGTGDTDPAVPRVDLSVSSPLPAELTSGCPQGQVSALGASLWVADHGVCPMTVSAAGVSGTCSGVTADGHRTLTLTYEVAANGTRLAEQLKTVLLDATSPDVVAVSFAGAAVDQPWDSDGDGVKNLTEWCAGTL